MNRNKKLTHATSFGMDHPGTPNDKLSAPFAGVKTATGKPVAQVPTKKQPGATGGTKHTTH